MITSTHRGHGHAVAKAFYSLDDDAQGDYAASLFAELFGRASGVSGGRGGSMHFYDQHNTGLLGTNGFVGGGLGLATGAGLAARLKGTDGVAVSFFGDVGVQCRCDVSSRAPCRESRTDLFDLPPVFAPR